MKIFSTHRRKMEPRRRFGGLEFRSKVKAASNYKRAFNPTSHFSLKIFQSPSILGRTSRVVFLGVILVLFYFFTVSSAFSISDVTISGNHQVSTEQIADVINADGNSRLFLVKKNNFFLMSRGRINKLLTSSIPTIKEVVSYDRSWPHKLTIEIKEHTPGFVIESNGNYFVIDDEGMVIEQTDDPKKLLVVHDQLTESFARGESLPNQKLTPFVVSMSKSWPGKINNPIASVKFPGKSSSEVQFVTTMGWSVLFDTSRSVSVQLSDLAVILSKQVRPADQPRLAYIDLRLEKWAYYCFKASPCEQQEQAQAGASTNVEEQ